MICFHHNDNDGRCGAAIVARADRNGVLKKRMGDDVTVEFEEMDYNKAIPFWKIAADELVIIVDFSFKPEDMSKVLDLTENVIWIDHHKTAEAYDYGRKLEGKRDFTEPGKSGALLAWEYFFPGEAVPLAVRLVSDYDTWQHKMTGDLEFQLGLDAKAWAKYPQNERWARLFGDNLTVRAISDSGIAIQSYRDSKCETYCTSFGYETEIGGHKAFAMNLYTFGSQGFGKRIKQYPICAGYVWDGSKWTVSLYSDLGVDTSVISKSHGGGGHSGASGFQCDELPFSKSTTEDE